MEALGQRDAILEDIAFTLSDWLQGSSTITPDTLFYFSMSKDTLYYSISHKNTRNLTTEL
jgi:hypothetical protein